MANNILSKANAGVTTVTTIYTVPALTTAIIGQLCIANQSTSTDTTVTVQLVKSTGTVTTSLCNSAPVPAAGNLMLLSLGQKLYMMTGDLVKVTCAAACDVSLGGVEFS